VRLFRRRAAHPPAPEREPIEVRRLFHEEVARVPLSDAARRVLDEIVEHEWFSGSSDPFVLEACAMLVRTTRAARVLQVGTHIGFSAVYLADVLPPGGRLWAVDPDDRTLPVAREFLARAGLLDRVEVVHGYSTDAAVGEQLRAAGPFEVVYLDSSHAYRSTLAELDLLFDGGVVEDGVLVLHDAAVAAAQFDPDGEGGVRRALDEWIAGRRDSFDLLVLEPPFWPGVCGAGFVRRRTTAAPPSAARP
jgi:predicted O-methyltransferase YrrM